MPKQHPLFEWDIFFALVVVVDFADVFDGMTAEPLAKIPSPNHSCSDRVL
jgi:hypothetical protein